MRRWRVAVMWITLAVAAQAAMAEGFPLPPTPPSHPPLGDNAPVPDTDATAPTRPVSEGASVDVRFYRVRQFDPSLGFVPGSRYQSTEDRKAIQTPGFSISVPLK